MKARLKYLAVFSDEPERLADFYVRNFGLDVIGRSADGDVTTTDGFFNLSFIKRRRGLGEPHTELGLHHLGVAVDSIREVEERYRSIYPSTPIVKEPRGLQFGEVRVFAPEAMPISLSETSFGIRSDEDRLPRIRHIACNAIWPEGLLNFFNLVFDFKELAASRERRSQGRENRFAGDGFTNLAIHPFYNESEGHEPRFGVNHFGFLVSDVAARVDRLSKKVPVAKRPDSRPYAECRLHDLENNKFDLSQTKGWEIGRDRWARAA
jgi:hypothetical protein